MSSTIYTDSVRSNKNCEKPLKDMRYIPLSNASYQIHNHIIFYQINIAMFQKIVPKDIM